jgi:hypothetical protein
MNTSLVCDGTPGLNASFILQAQDDSGSPFGATGTATIDNYAQAFVVAAGGNAFQIVPKVTMTPGQATQTVTATFQMSDSASGVALPPLPVSVDLVAPPNPSQKATKVVITAGPSAGTGSGLTDPGSASIAVSLS